MSELKKVLMQRDALSEADADEIINGMVQMIEEGADPEEVLHDEVGLEPDYVFDLLDLL